LDWLVDNFTTKVPGVANTLVVSSDGLPIAASTHLDRASGDQLAAIASGLSSLTQGAARCLSAGNVNQVMVEMDEGFMFVMAIGEGSVLTVLASASADLGLVGYEMALLVARVGGVLTPETRAT
jgi:predicted regulator of Ras-like GTPase activity (Roadblock/LC7/MglB family)